MEPIGLLMKEHRLIERMVCQLEKHLHQIETKQETQVEFINTAADFFRTYADRTHHGKEEDILFNSLSGKDLSPEHKAMVEELVQEHVFSRKTVSSLLDAGRRYGEGNSGALAEVKERISDLLRLYPAHIQKEDNRFFFPSMEYFSQEEKDRMLEEFYRFDQSMIHEKYEKLLSRLEEGR